MKYSKSVIDLIRERISRRDYSSKEFENKKLKELHNITKKSLVGPFGGESRFLILDTKNQDPNYKIKIGTYGMVTGARYYIASIIKKSKHNTIDCGYSFEKLILKATEMELGTVWLGSKYISRNLNKEIPLKELEYIPAISPIGYPKEKLTIKEKAIFWGIKARKRKPWSELFYQNNFTNLLSIEEAGKFKLPLEMVRLAPSAKNGQPWRILIDNQMTNFHFYIETQVKTSDDKISKFNLLDIGIAICHFDLTTKELKLKGQWLSIDPKIDTNKRNLHYILSWQTK